MCDRNLNLEVQGNHCRINYRIFPVPLLWVLPLFESMLDAMALGNQYPHEVTTRSHRTPEKTSGAIWREIKETTS